MLFLEDFAEGTEQYKKLLRRFPLDKLLIRINEESADILKNSIEPGIRSALVEKCVTPIKNSRLCSAQRVAVTAWALIDLAYDAILATNDYRGNQKKVNKEVSENELYSLVIAMYSVKLPESNKDKDKLPFNVYGFAGEQFKMQRFNNAIKTIPRELYILFEIASKVDSKFNVADIVQKETGVSWKNVLSILSMIFFASCKNSDINKIKDCILCDTELTETDIDKVINRYSMTYKEVKDSPLHRQCLYTKPYIITQHKDLLSINVFLNLCLCEHCIL